MILTCLCQSRNRDASSRHGCNSPDLDPSRGPCPCPARDLYHGSPASPYRTLLCHAGSRAYPSRNPSPALYRRGHGSFPYLSPGRGHAPCMIRALLALGTMRDHCPRAREAPCASGSSLTLRPQTPLSISPAVEGKSIRQWSRISEIEGPEILTFCLLIYLANAAFLPSSSSSALYSGKSCMSGTACKRAGQKVAKTRETTTLGTHTSSYVTLTSIGFSSFLSAYRRSSCK